MNHLIGCSGFIGSAIRKAVLHRGDFRFYTSKRTSTAHDASIYFSLEESTTWENLALSAGDKAIFLSWQNLPNYNEPFHITHNLVKSLEFFEYAATLGISKLVIAGTCYEYGLQNGELREDMPTYPVNSYAVAKDALRRLTESLCAFHGTTFAWLRIFYPYGEGQNPNSLIPSLARAIAKGEKSFDTSQGDQIRDFIRVEDVAEAFVRVTDSPLGKGIINVGSGNPISIRDFLEAYIREKEATIKLNLGVYPRRADEPLAFWANCSRLKRILLESGNSTHLEVLT